MKILIIATLLAFTAFADTDPNIVDVKDVETLKDDLSKFDGKMVRISGEVEDKLDGRAIVLESGGLVNNEILVITVPKSKGHKVDSLKEDSEITVVGKLVSRTLSEMRKEYNWEMKPSLVDRVKGVKTFLVADEIFTAVR